MNKKILTKQFLDDLIASGDYDGNLRLFDKDSSTPLWTYSSGGDINKVAISSDNEYIIAGSEDGDNKIYLFKK